MIQDIIAKWFPPLWQSGICNGRNAKRNQKTGEVQFVLWRAGERGHKVDYWHPFDSYWWPEFKPQPPTKENEI